ncbi:MAG: hypothetical protein ABI462_07715, partial [Ignavibacteria bacterium]
VFHRKKNISFIAELGVSFPTASESELGFEEFILYPSTGAVFELKKGFTGLILSYYRSLNSSNNTRSFINDRGDTVSKTVNEISLLPLYKFAFPGKLYCYIKPDIRFNFESNKVFVPFTAEFGKYFHPHWVLSLSGSFHISNKDKRYDVNLIAGISYLIN